MRRLVAARADVEARLARANAEAQPPLRLVLSELQASYAPLPALLDALQEIDAKPTPGVEAAANAAIKRAEAALAAAGL
jgi:hypothetical protein